MPLYNANTDLLMGYQIPQINPVPERMGQIMTLADMMDKRKARKMGEKALEELYKKKRVQANLANLTPTIMGQVTPPAETIEPIIEGMGDAPFKTGDSYRSGSPSQELPPGLMTGRVSVGSQMPIGRGQRMGMYLPPLADRPTNKDLELIKADRALAQYKLEQLDDKGIPQYIKDEEETESLLGPEMTRLSRRVDEAGMNPDIQPRQVSQEPAIKPIGYEAPTVIDTEAELPGEFNLQEFQRLIGATPNGELGPETTEATKRFQEAMGLDVDGIIGPDTIQAFESVYNDPATQMVPQQAVPQQAVPQQVMPQEQQYINNFQAQPRSAVTTPETVAPSTGDPLQDMYESLQRDLMEVQSTYDQLRNQPGLSGYAEQWREGQMGVLKSKSDMINTLAGAQEKRAKTQNLESKLTEMQDITIGNYMEKFFVPDAYGNTPWDNMSEEQKNNTASDLINSGVDQFKAMQARQNPQVFINKARNSALRMASDLKKAEIDRKKEQDKLDAKYKAEAAARAKLKEDRDYALKAGTFNLARDRYMKEDAMDRDQAEAAARQQEFQLNTALGQIDYVLSNPELARKYAGASPDKFIGVITDYQGYETYKNTIEFIATYLSKDVIKSKMLGSQITENDRAYMVALGAGPNLKVGLSSPEALLEAVERARKILNKLVKIDERPGNSGGAIKPKGSDGNSGGSGGDEIPTYEFDPKTGKLVLKKGGN